MKSILEPIETYSVVGATVVLALIIGASDTVAAHGGSGVGGGMMGSGWGGFGLFGLGMLLWPFVLVGLVLVLVYAVGSAGRTEQVDPALAELRERYARGELSDEEFESRRTSLER